MFVLSGQGTAEVFELVIVLAALGPFIGPAESALVPTLVARASLTSANAFLNFMRYVAQVAGLAIPAPVLMRTAGVETLFLVTGIFFGAPGGIGAALAFLRERGMSGRRRFRTRWSRRRCHCWRR